MFVIKEKLIQKIDFCYSFLRTENMYVFECKIETKIGKYMLNHCCTREQAVSHFSRNY